MATKFTPVELTDGTSKRTPRTAAEDAKLRFDGWHLPTKPKSTKTEAKPTAPKQS